nr:outer membrane beta-barrel protein [uncultured Chitinophaga sp.]
MLRSNNLLPVLLLAHLFLITPLLAHAQQPAGDTLPPPKVRQLSEISIIQQKALVERKTDRLIYNVTSSVGAAGANGLEVMARVPGLRVTDNLIAIAGKGAVKVMINGRIIPLAGEDLQRYLKSMSAGEIARVEVITNPSAAYDADGNAGLINIVTRRDRNQGFSGEIQASGKLSDYGFKKLYGVSNYGTMSAGGNFSYNTTKWSLYGNLNYEHGRFLEGFGIDLQYPNRFWSQTDTGNYKIRNLNLVLGTDYKISNRTTIGFNYSGARTAYIGDDHVNNPVFNTSGVMDSLLRTFATYQPVAWSTGLNLHLVTKLDSSGRQFSVDADYFNYYRTDKSDFISQRYDGKGAPIANGTTRYFDTNKQAINIYTLKADLQWPTTFANYAFGGKLSFINNYSNVFYYKNLPGEMVYDKDLSNEYDYTENTQAVYATASKEAGKWKLNAGLRMEATQTKGVSHVQDNTMNNNYVKLFPSFSADWNYHNDNHLAFTFGKRINRPVFWDLNPYKSLTTAYSYLEGNPYLQPEYNSNFELSHHWQQRFTAAAFLNITNNGFNRITVATPDNNIVYTTPVNFLKIYRYGLSASATLQPLPWLESINQVSGYHTDARSALPNIPDIDGLSVYLATNNNIALNKDKTLMVALNFWCQFPEVDHNGKSNTYYNMDLGLKAVCLQNRMSIALNGADLFRSSASIVRSTVNNIPQTFTHFQVNRHIRLSVSYKLGQSTRKREVRGTGSEEERKRT